MKKRPDSEAYYQKLQREQIRLSARLAVLNKRIESFAAWQPAKTGKPGPRSWTRADRKERIAYASEDAFWRWLESLPTESVVFTDSEESLLAVWTAAQSQPTNITK